MVVQSSVKNVFIRGSVVRYIHLPGGAVDTALLEDATRRGMHILYVCASGRTELIDGGDIYYSTEAAQQASKAR